MNVYFVVINDINSGGPDYNYPTEIRAKDKQEAFKLVAENIPEGDIYEVLTIQELSKAYPNHPMLDKYINSREVYDIEPKKNITSDNIAESTSDLSFISEVTPTEPKYYKDGETFFKFDKGVLYKKTWVNVENEVPYEEGDTTENNEESIPTYRIVNKDTFKLIKSDKYIIQVFTWVEVGK